MGTKIKWGVLSTATIAVEQTIPAMLRSKYCDLIGISSRNIEKAKDIAGNFGIKKFYGDYQSLLDDPEIDAVYIPLPNHLHVPWAIKALQSGKHVLLEKPVALSSEEAQQLIDEAKKYPELRIMEAFMYKFHPQWIRVKEMIRQGEIGNLRNIQSSFSFFEDDPESIVNNKEYGGGSLMDIGCYPISLSRFLYDAEPQSVVASIKIHPDFKVDTLASGILEFKNGTSSFFSATLLEEDQRVKIFGDQGSITFEIPFNPEADREARIWLEKEGVKEEIIFDQCDQYALQADEFSLRIIKDQEVPVLLEDALNNMIIIEKLRESDQKAKRINL